MVRLLIVISFLIDVSSPDQSTIHWLECFLARLETNFELWLNQSEPEILIF